MSIRLVLPGRTIETTQESVENAYHRVATVRQKQLDTATRGGPEPTEELDCADDAVLELEFADGTKQWISAAELREDLRKTDPLTQNERGTRIPSLMAAETAERGIGGLALKALKIFKVDPVDLAADATVHKVIEKFETKNVPEQGLFFFPHGDRLGARVKKGELTAGQTYLVFLHGTASSSKGSFGKMAGTAEWGRLRDRYGDRILAFEHATFSKSPIQNAIELAEELPKNAKLHLVSHSRGGLVGELLSLDPAQDVPVLKDVFAARAQDADAIAALMDVLRKRAFQVERFVRVACPARGTTLASKRLDLYLSAVLNLIEFVPLARDSVAVEFLRAVVLETAKRRTSSQELPGIEAMMPESPLIRMLNTVAKSKAPVAVIAGDAEGRGVLGRLKQLAIDAFFLAKNDYVVNTEAMYGGMPRPGVTRPPRVFDQGSGVNHFSYFANPKTRAMVASGLEKDALEAGFERGGLPMNVERLLRELPKDAVITDEAARRMVEDYFARGTVSGADRGILPAAFVNFFSKLPPNAPVLFLLPGIMGSHITLGKDRIWLEPASLAMGGMKKMGDLGQCGPDGILNSFYGTLSTYLRGVKGFDVREFAYDWRKSLLNAAKNLAAEVEAQLKQSNAPVFFLAHSMGGLVVRTMIAHHGKVWQDVKKRGGRLLMLGTPNAGSYAVAVTLAGHNSLVSMLGKVDVTKSEAELRGIIRGFPGLIELLSEDLFDEANWLTVSGVVRPERALLREAKEVRDSIKDAVDSSAMLYVAGTGATPHGWKVKDGKVEFLSEPGDGTVTHACGLLPGVRTWYVDASHGNLANKLSAFDAYAELLKTGSTRALSETPIRARGGTEAAPIAAAPAPVLFPTAEELAAAALGAVPDAGPVAADVTLDVAVLHGDLRYCELPVAVGHYENDTVVSAEWALDQALDGELSKRFKLGVYPGPAGTVEVVLPAGSRPAGALIIGLGPVGEVSFTKVRDGIAAAAMRLALQQTGDAPVSFASLLIGTYGGRNSLSISESVRAVVSGVIRANRALAGAKSLKRIERLELIELFEDCATQAAEALDRLTETLPQEEPGVQLTMSPRYVIAIEGGRYMRPSVEYPSDWWRRVQIKHTAAKGVAPLDGEQLLQLLRRARQRDDRAGVEKFVTELLDSNLAPDLPRSAQLEFVALTDRARAEERGHTVQTALVDGLVRQMVGTPNTDNDFAKALFELMIPPDFKADAAAGNLLLVLDRGAAQYPWELLAPRRGADSKPLALERGLIRQFRTTQGRLRPTGATQRSALVIGDPLNDLFQLAGAEREARQVAFTLKDQGYEVTERYQPDSLAAVTALLARDYRVIHIAGHGEFDAENPINSGVLLKGGAKITPAEIRSLSTVPDLVFLNCCHLGSIQNEEQRAKSNFHELAASVSEELINIGVRAVVAAGWAVDDGAAVTFANTFYQRMLEGWEFGDAVLAARKATHLQNGANNNTWGAYQCYGNTAFTLENGGWKGGGSAPRFYARNQVRQHLANLNSRMKLAHEAGQEVIRKELRDLEASLPAHWKDGELLADLGFRWAELGDYDKCDEVLARALAAESGASFKAVEVRANQQARRAAKMPLSKHSRNLFRESAKTLEYLIRRYPTSERWSLLGGTRKRQAIVLADAQESWTSVKRELLGACTAYHQARILAERGGLNAFYPATNWMVCALLLGGDEATRAAAELRELQARLARPGTAEANRTVWDRFYDEDALLLTRLAEGKLTDPLCRTELIERYRKEMRGVSPSEVDSATTQMRFVQSMLQAQGRAAEAKSLGELRTALASGAPVATSSASPAGSAAPSRQAASRRATKRTAGKQTARKPRKK